MRFVGVRNSPASGRAAVQRQSRPHSILDDSKISRPPLRTRANDIERLASLLVERERRSLIEPHGADGLGLTNVADLELLAGRALSVLTRSFHSTR